jgi:hypothetical protein
MANELKNASILMNDTDFRNWITAAMVYVARSVVTEATTVTNHTARFNLAKAILLNPAQFTGHFVNLIATQTDVAGIGSTVAALGQPLIIQKVTDEWNNVTALLS